MGADVSSSAYRVLSEGDLASAREQLDAAMFETAWAEGRAMTLEEAVTQALAEVTT